MQVVAAKVGWAGELLTMTDTKSIALDGSGLRAITPDSAHFESVPAVRPEKNAQRWPCPHIGAVPERTSRFLWSVMIPVYNCVKYLPETLESVLAQDPGAEHMQIEVIDNCSTDNPEVVVRDVGKGRIGFHRQPNNVGAIENFNTCIRRSSGEWVHILHGDDTVRPGFYAHARQAAIDHPHIGAIVYRFINMDEDSHWLTLPELEARAPGILGDDFFYRLFLYQRIQFAGIIVRRSVYEELGGFRVQFGHCSDWDMWKRIAAQKRIFYDPEPLACFRDHTGSDTSRAVRTGTTAVDERLSIEASSAELLNENAEPFRREAMKAAGIRAVWRARTSLERGDGATAARQLRQAVRCSLAPAVLARIAGLFMGTIVQTVI